MNAKTIVQPTLLAAAALLLTACAGDPQTAGDRTPAWLKHHVTGTRIPRKSDAAGDPSTAGYVVTTTEEELANLPSVARRTNRGPALR